MNEKDRNQDPEFLERTNPFFNTAKMTLFQLALLGNPHASAIAEKMGLTYDEMQNDQSLSVKPEPKLPWPGGSASECGPR